MFLVPALAILCAMSLALIRAALGPTVFDRVLAANTFGTKTVVILSILGSMTRGPNFLDLALLYALINFIGTLAVLKFFEYRDLARRVDYVGNEEES
jgi:multicomponent Na+:H+ antiporter subunit F